MGIAGGFFSASDVLSYADHLRKLGAPSQLFSSEFLGFNCIRTKNARSAFAILLSRRRKEGTKLSVAIPSFMCNALRDVALGLEFVDLFEYSLARDFDLPDLTSDFFDIFVAVDYFGWGFPLKSSVEKKVNYGELVYDVSHSPWSHRMVNETCFGSFRKVIGLPLSGFLKDVRDGSDSFISGRHMSRNELIPKTYAEFLTLESEQNFERWALDSREEDIFWSEFLSGLECSHRRNVWSCYYDQLADSFDICPFDELRGFSPLTFGFYAGSLANEFRLRLHENGIWSAKYWEAHGGSSESDVSELSNIVHLPIDHRVSIKIVKVIAGFLK